MSSPNDASELTIEDLGRILQTDEDAEVLIGDDGHMHVRFTAYVSGPPGGLIIGALADED